ncbi:MAG: AAA family ATPase [Clostridia bacterium]|nr:AAA family ATPase [Clostridia bacterium]
MVLDHAEQLKERNRLKKVYNKIEKELIRRKNEIKACKKEIVESRRTMGENVASSPQQFEEMVQAQQYIDELKREYEKYAFAHSQVQRLEKTAFSPYFARIDFKEDGQEETEAIYIGTHAFIDDKTREIYIYDWRAPISSIFYDFEIGPAEYDCPEGKIRGHLSLKRQFRIFRDNIEYMFDSSIKIDDEILQKILSKSADEKMRNIVATIQREQNRIIRNEKNRLLIVQGAAGSGKTSIALHRAAYLLYRHRNNISSKSIVIFSPSQIFNDYISDVLPELGEQNILQNTFMSFAKPYFENGVRLEDSNDQMEFLLDFQGEKVCSSRENAISFKASDCFLAILKGYVEIIEKGHFNFEDISFENNRIISKEELLELYDVTYRNLPLAKRMARIKDRVYYLLAPVEKNELNKTQDELENQGEHKGEAVAASRAIVSRKFKSLRDYIESMSEVDVYGLYIRLFEEDGLLQSIAQGMELPADIEEIKAFTLKKLKDRYVPYEDAAPLLFLKGELEGVPETQDIKHVIIDEAQDYSIIHYEVFRQHFQNSSITMLGDLNQSIYLHGGKDYDSIRDIFRGFDSVLVTLTKSYRSTKEIVEFSKGILDNGQEVEAVNRSGNKPCLIKTQDEQAMLDAIEQDLSCLKTGEFKSAAIICKTASECKKVFGRLKDRLEISLISKDDDEFAKGIVVIPAYLSKGLEFDMVMLYNAGEESYSRENERRLFYVACTRALHRLSIYFSGNASPFINGINRELYDQRHFNLNR